jgi:hypothetical protein
MCNTFSFSDLGITDIQAILDNIDKISKTYNVFFQENFLTNLTHLANIYKSQTIENEGQTKLVLQSSQKTVPKIYKWQIQFQQEREFYNILSRAGYSHILAQSIFFPCYSIQEKLTPLTCNDTIPHNLENLIHDSGAAQFGKNKQGSIKILDFENFNLNSLSLKKTQYLNQIFKKKG